MADLPLHLFPVQQAVGRFLLGLSAAEAGGVLVMGVVGKIVGSQRDTEFAVGGILDGNNFELKIGVNLNIHRVNCLYYISVSNLKIKIQKVV